VNYSTGADNNSYAVSVGDFNGDGKVDIAASGDGCCGGQVVVFLGNGDGTFQPSVAYATGTFNPGSVVAADVNGDGRLDLVASGLTSSVDAEVSVQLGKGDGTFRPAILSTL